MSSSGRISTELAAPMHIRFQKFTPIFRSLLPFVIAVAMATYPFDHAIAQKFSCLELELAATEAAAAQRHFAQEHSIKLTALKECMQHSGVLSQGVCISAVCRLAKEGECNALFEKDQAIGARIDRIKELKTLNGCSSAR